MSRKYKFYEKEGAYFISFAVVDWIDVFVRMEYFNIVISSLKYCRKQKGMLIFAYCIMPSHIHLIFRSLNGDPSGLIRDFKGFTSRKLLQAIAENKQESRREWLMEKFATAGSNNSNVKKYQFWQQNNQPIEIWSNHVFEKNLNYVHMNPVKSQFVSDPTEWRYSSARNNVEGKVYYLEIDVI